MSGIESQLEGEVAQIGAGNSGAQRVSVRAGVAPLLLGLPPLFTSQISLFGPSFSSPSPLLLIFFGSSSRSYPHRSIFKQIDDDVHPIAAPRHARISHSAQLFLPFHPFLPGQFHPFFGSEWEREWQSADFFLLVSSRPHLSSDRQVCFGDGLCRNSAENGNDNGSSIVVARAGRDTSREFGSHSSTFGLIDSVVSGTHALSASSLQISFAAYSITPCSFPTPRFSLGAVLCVGSLGSFSAWADEGQHRAQAIIWGPAIRRIDTFPGHWPSATPAVLAAAAIFSIFD